MISHDVRALLYRLAEAMNEHDVDNLTGCFHEEYQSIQPAHPERSFVGRENVQANWSWVFSHFEDFQARLVDYVIRDCDVWTEWEWGGTDPDGRRTTVRGVMILTIEDGLIREGRLYLEPVA